jgi:hypothetical protein
VVEGADAGVYAAVRAAAARSSSLALLTRGG